MPRDRKSLEDHKLQNTKPQYVLPDSDVIASRPSFPKNISQSAKKKFKQLVRMLEQRRTVTAGDQEILRLYVVLFDRHERALGRLLAEGDIVDSEVVSKTGEVYTVQKTNPSLKIAEVCETKMANILSQLGLTPRTRTQVKATVEKKKEDEFPTRETATAPAPEVDLLSSIDETKVN